MSSRKQFRVSMNADFLRRMNRVRPAADVLGTVLPVVLQAVEIWEQEQIRREVLTMRDEQQGMAEVLERLQTSVADGEHRTSAALRRHADRLDELAQQSDVTAAAVVAVDSALRGALDAERAQREADLADVRRLQNARQDSDDRAAAAWLADTHALVDVISAMPHEQFAPGCLRSVKAQLATAVATLRHGQSQAALASAQALAHQLSELRLDIELRRLELARTRQNTQRALRTLAEQASLAGRSALVEVADGEAVRWRIDGDYWAKEEFDLLRSEIANLETEAGRDVTSLARLGGIADVEVPRLQERTAAAVEQARRALYLASARSQVAENAARELEEGFDYAVVEAGYERDDARGAFIARLAHRNSSEYVVRVLTTADYTSDPQAAVDLTSYDADLASEELRLSRGEAVRQAVDRGLAGEGSGAGTPTPLREVVEQSRQRPGPRSGLQPGSGHGA
jgi:hypothetical protein